MTAVKRPPFDSLLAPAGAPLRIRPNRWDWIALPILLGVVVAVIQGARQMAGPLETVTQTPISLEPRSLPGYALLTTLRMFIAMAASLVFTFVYGAAAARSRRLERVLIPILDILQSVPVLGYLSFSVIFFMALFPGRALGMELVAIFAIFTSQAWNMAFSFYQSLRTIPEDLQEAARSFRLTGWLRFWRLDVPFAMPGLVWNIMMSMSGGWFFVVASEAISVGGQEVFLPGVGSYVAVAIARSDMTAIIYAITAMFVVIVLYDQLLFRPFVAWSSRFSVEQIEAERVPQSWMLLLFRQAQALRRLMQPVGAIGRRIITIGAPASDPSPPRTSRNEALRDIVWRLVVGIALVATSWALVDFLRDGIAWVDIRETVILGLFTLGRVVVLIAVASIIWVPVGVYVGRRPSLAEKVQPLIQILAAFPANLLFPFFVMAIVRYQLNPAIWLSPLMILGTQWYILFNVIAGTLAFPEDLNQASRNLGVRGWLWWKNVMLPGIFPYYVTGAITASGGSWNASIVAEIASWGDTTLVTRGLGAYIQQVTTLGDYPRIVLGIAVMSAYVVLFNRAVWRPLYAFAERRLRVG